MTEVDLRDDRDQHRYVGSLDGQDAGVLVYAMRGDDVIDLRHTEVADAFEGQGVGGSLVRQVLDDVRARGLRIVPTCPFVASYLKRHPDDADLVAT